jgi:hypothetical protein
VIRAFRTGGIASSYVSFFFFLQTVVANFLCGWGNLKFGSQTYVSAAQSLFLALFPYSEKNKKNVRFEVFAAVAMKNAVFWDVVQCRSCVDRRFGGTSVHTRSTLRHIPEDGIVQIKKSL